MLGQLLKLRESPLTLFSGSGDGAWHTLDLSANVDPNAKAVLIGVRPGIYTPGLRRFNAFIRTDASHAQFQYRADVRSNGTRSNYITNMWIVPLTAAKTIQYYFPSGSSGGFINLFGELKPGMALQSGFDLVAIPATDGVFLSQGSATAWTTITPAGLPKNAFAFWGTIHQYCDYNWGQIVQTRGSADQRALGVYSTVRYGGTGSWYFLQSWHHPLQPVVDGSFDYLFTPTDGTEGGPRDDVSIYGVYALVPGRKGKNGYRFGDMRPSSAALASNVSGPFSTYIKQTAVDCKPGDLVLVQVTGSYYDYDGLSEYGGSFKAGARLRECLTENHQYYEVAFDETSYGTTTAHVNACWLRVDENCQFEWCAPGYGSRHVDLHQLATIPRVRL